jgi:hypothetical protein
MNEILGEKETALWNWLVKRLSSEYAWLDITFVPYRQWDDHVIYVVDKRHGKKRRYGYKIPIHIYPSFNEYRRIHSDIMRMEAK